MAVQSVKSPWMFITVFTKPATRLYSKQVQYSTYFNPNILRYVLILSCHTNLYSAFSSSRTKCTLSVLSCVPGCLSHYSDWVTAATIEFDFPPKHRFTLLPMQSIRVDLFQQVSTFLVWNHAALAHRRLAARRCVPLSQIAFPKKLTALGFRDSAEMCPEFRVISLLKLWDSLKKFIWNFAIYEVCILKQVPSLCLYKLWTLFKLVWTYFTETTFPSLWFYLLLCMGSSSQGSESFSNGEELLRLAGGTGGSMEASA